MLDSLRRALAIGFLVIAASSPLGRSSSAGAATGPDPHQDIADLNEQGKYAEAEGLARERLAAVEGRSGPESIEAADVVDQLVTSLWRLGKVKDGEALRLAQRAVRIRESRAGTAPGTRPEDLSRSLSGLSQVLAASGDLKGSRPPLERALELREQALGPDHPEVGKLLINLGVLHGRMGEYATARTYLERALEVSRRTLPPGDANLGFSLVNLGNVDSLLGDYETALARHEEALRIFEAAYGPDHPHTTAALLNVGSVLSALGDYAGALERYPRAIASQRRTLGDTHAALGRSLASYGELLRIVGQHDEARRVLEEALSIQRQASGPDSAELRTPLLNLATLRIDQREYAAAAADLALAESVTGKGLGPDHPDRLSIFENLAQVRLRLGDLDGAAVALDRARALADLHLPPDHPARARLDVIEGSLRARQGNLAAARVSMERALAAVQARFGPAHLTVIDVRSRLARIDWALGDKAAALEQAREASAAQERALRDAMAVLPEARALRLAAWRPLPERVLFAGLLEDADRRPEWLAAAWDWILGSRGVVLEEISARKVVGSLGDAPEVREALAALSRASNRMAAVWVKGSDPKGGAAFESKLAEARQARENAESELALASRRYREVQRFLPARRAEVAAGIPEGGALIEVVRVSTRFEAVGDEVDAATLRYVALRLDPDGTMDAIDLGPAEALERLVARWRAGLKGSVDRASGKGAVAEAREASRALGGAVGRPLLRLAGDARRIFLVPDGALHQVYLPALLQEDGRYLIEHGPSIHLLSTGRDLPRLRQPAASGEDEGGLDLLAMGGVRFPAMPVAEGGRGPAGDVTRALSTCAALNTVAWPALPESRREVALVSRMFEGRGAPLALTGSDATEARLKREAPARGVLHLATHGWFLDETCIRSDPNPLLLSGLVLAPEGKDDGVLTAEEVATLDLSKIGLTVLSACNTGLGPVTAGEGVFGLRRALEIAGSRSTVMSLWPVPDRQARRWMTSFYEGWLEGQPVFEAADRASRLLLDDHRKQGDDPHPYSWGGFVTTGDWRPPASATTQPPPRPATPQGQGTRSQ